MNVLLGAAASASAFAWTYNRSNYTFDAGQRQQALHQGQNMQIQSANLYRQDLRDLFGMTIAKMDAYKVVGTVITTGVVNCVLRLGFEDPVFCVAEIVQMNAIANAIVMGLLSVWYATHGSIIAHSVMVRMMTQAIRLPIATREQIDAARTQGQSYESQGIANVLRLPYMRSAAGGGPPAPAEPTLAASVGGHSDADGLTEPSGKSVDGEGSDYTPNTPGRRPDQNRQSLFALNNGSNYMAMRESFEHFELFQYLQSNWQSFDA
jgi:hypothetical protein